MSPPTASANSSLPYRDGMPRTPRTSWGPYDLVHLPYYFLVRLGQRSSGFHVPLTDISSLRPKSAPALRFFFSGRSPLEVRLVKVHEVIRRPWHRIFARSLRLKVNPLPMDASPRCGILSRKLATEGQLSDSLLTIRKIESPCRRSCPKAKEQRLIRGC